MCLILNAYFTCCIDGTLQSKFPFTAKLSIVLSSVLTVSILEVNAFERERERETETETDRQTDRDRETQRETHTHNVVTA